jgi:hypothetical protein
VKWKITLPMAKANLTRPWENKKRKSYLISPSIPGLTDGKMFAK